MPENKSYLGDGLYAEHDGRGVTLWTDRHDVVSDPRAGGVFRHWVYLEPSVFTALVEFWRRATEQPRCTCHPRDGSYACPYCYEQGIRGHLDGK
jgi:hypothetical protein